MDDTMLQKLHKVNLEMLDEFDRICRKYDIPYFLDSGTALGAIRHGGFIPWDDDADVGLLREDYERFLAVARDELDPAYVIVTRAEDHNYPNMYAKIRKLYTIYPQKIYEKCENQGIHLDLFPYDCCPDDAGKAKRRIRKIRFMRLIYAKVYGVSDSESAVRRFFKACLGLFPVEVYRKILEKAILKHNKLHTGHVTSYTCPAIKERDIYVAVKDLYPVKDVQFEDRTYKIMNDPDAYLKALYGDYMKLPPEDQRRYHLCGEVIFDTRQQS